MNIYSSELSLAISKYLSEFDSEIKREKARENLGIKSLKKFWGEIEGSIEDLKDLIELLNKIDNSKESKLKESKLKEYEDKLKECEDKLKECEYKLKEHEDKLTDCRNKLKKQEIPSVPTDITKDDIYREIVKKLYELSVRIDKLEIPVSLEASPNSLWNQSADACSFIVTVKTNRSPINVNISDDFVTVVPLEDDKFLVNCLANSKKNRLCTIEFSVNDTSDSIDVIQEGFEWIVDKNFNISSSAGLYEIPIEWKGALDGAGAYSNTELIKSVIFDQSRHKLCVEVSETFETREGLITVFNNPEIEPYINIKIIQNE